MSRTITASGITLLEILVALAIIAVLATIIFSVFHNFSDSASINSAAEAGITALSDARSRTLSSKNASQYGVHFASSSLVIFKGAVYSALGQDNEEKLLPAGTEISVINLAGGGVNVAFKRLTGETDSYGTTTFRLINKPTATRDVVILSSGAVKINN